MKCLLTSRLYRQQQRSVSGNQVSNFIVIFILISSSFAVMILALKDLVHAAINIHLKVNLMVYTNLI